MFTELRQALERRVVAELAFEAVDQRFVAMDRRFDARLEGVERRLDTLDQKVSRQFVWLIGIQVSILLAVVAALTAG